MKATGKIPDRHANRRFLKSIYTSIWDYVKQYIYHLKGFNSFQYKPIFVSNLSTLAVNIYIYRLKSFLVHPSEKRCVFRGAGSNPVLDSELVNYCFAHCLMGLGDNKRLTKLSARIRILSLSYFSPWVLFNNQPPSDSENLLCLYHYRCVPIV